MPTTRTAPATSTCRPSANLALRAGAPLSVPSLNHCPPHLLLPRVRAEQRAERSCRRHRAGHPSPPCLDSSRPKPPHLALHLLRPSTNPSEPSPGQIGPCDDRTPLLLRRSSASAVDPHLRALLLALQLAKRTRGEPLNPSGLSPHRIPHLRCRNTAEPPWPGRRPSRARREPHVRRAAERSSSARVCRPRACPAPPPASLASGDTAPPLRRPWVMACVGCGWVGPLTDPWSPVVSPCLGFFSKIFYFG
jgi:hypothetical protein